MCTNSHRPKSLVEVKLVEAGMIKIALSYLGSNKSNQLMLRCTYFGYVSDMYGEFITHYI